MLLIYPRYLAAQGKEFDRLLACASRSRRPSVEAVHGLRVAIRRIRAVLWILKQEGRGDRKLDRGLRKLSRGLGAARELDVARRDARVYRLDSKPLKHLRRRRRREAHRLLVRTHRKKLKRRVHDLLDSLHRCDATAAVSRLQSQLSQVGQSDLHLLRIEARKVRYVLEALGETYPSLEQLQKSAGKAHDLEVLAQLLDHPPQIRRDLSRYSRLARSQACVALEDAKSALRLKGRRT
jgi:CHAD domain-containing protein